MAEIKMLSVEEARQEIEGGRFTIDTRFPFDYFGGRVPGSLNLPGRSIETRKTQVPDRPLLFVSEDDDAGVEAAEFAQSIGFADVAVLEGGIDAWMDAGYPTETASDGLAPMPEIPKPPQ